MPMPLKRILAATTVAATLFTAPLVSARLDSKEPLQSYRQSYFAIVAMNFGPIADMVKGDIPWDLEMLQGWAKDLETVTELNLLRGFAPGSEKGTTRAKPAIWDNMDDFEAKLTDLSDAAKALDKAAEGGDRAAIAEAVKATGGTCKACHDDYKSKDYLY
ncbi:c-type cytochrome [Pseudohaliea rubra]|uniref:Putative c'cytochrome n=1 Tax=Pseudohaliea rubra DSM 19751 TaxID=1265313 RepID=A0A095WW50_9GAMM|nr:cytochrome c [Pseudohaliea rubra]KGE02879.1 putative c'cytochrome [Pseudohaliea rubra DSM 19751]